MDTIAEDEEQAPLTAASLRQSSAKEPPQLDTKPTFARTPGENEESLDGCSEVLITELKGPDAESKTRVDILRLSDEEEESESEEDEVIYHEDEDVNEIVPEPEVDEEAKKWALLNSAEDWDTDLEMDENELYANLHDTTGRSKYLRYCEELGVVPCSYFIRHILDPEITMKYHGLGPNGTTALAKVLKNNITAEKLNLDGNWMESEGAKSIAEMLSENDFITKVSLACNQLGSTGAEYMAVMLATNHTLKSADLSGNFFEDKDAELFANAIEKNRNLLELSLADNKFGSAAAEWLGPAIGANDNMKKLDLSWNQIRFDGAKAIAAGLKENVRLSHFNVSWNGLASDGGCAVIDALLSNSTISEIDISGNRLDDDCARRVARVLATSDSLEILRMGMNPITTSGAVTIIASLLKNEQSILKLLDLSEIPVEFEFIRIKEELKGKRENFEVIHGPILRSGNTHDDIGKPAIDPNARHPLLILKEHILVNDTRIVTALRKFDPGNTLCVTKDDFMSALDELEIKYWRSQIDDVAKKLDKYRNGKIYYGDFIPPDGPKREPALGEITKKTESEP